MLAAQIGDQVETHLRSLHDEEVTLFRRELGICVGEARIDVAAVNGSITGCEIKGASDGLSRLPRQVDFYNRIVDIAVLVVERVHPQRVAALVPPWWGVWHVVDNAGAVTLEVLRDCGRNPTVQPVAVAQLLWRGEAYNALRDRGLHKGLSSATRWRLWNVLADQVPLDELREEVRQRLKARQEW